MSLLLDALKKSGDKQQSHRTFQLDAGRSDTVAYRFCLRIVNQYVEPYCRGKDVFRQEEKIS